MRVLRPLSYKQKLKEGVEEAICIDVSPIESPKKNAIQAKAICTALVHSKEHDFRLFKDIKNRYSNALCPLGFADTT
jgi:hypothetical protein